MNIPPARQFTLEHKDHLVYPKHQRTPQKIAAPSTKELLLLRMLILTVVILVLQFGNWYLKPDHIGYAILFWILTFSFGYKMLHLFYQFHYFSCMKLPDRPHSTRTWAVDMLTTYVPGEPYDMVVETLQAMVNVRYPHTTYLCDEGNDAYLKSICQQLGVVHVYRGTDKTGAKAGNINYTLQYVATGKLCVILDPDHVPVPEFIDSVLPYFEDDKVGYVQCIQGYANHDENFVTKGAAEQTYLFYGPIMMGMQGNNTVQAIGANCTFRRAALDSIGGHAIGLCEDMHTSMQIHAKRWKSVYIPELLTRGRVPSSISAYYKQQLKWSRGSFELLFEVYPKLFRFWTWRQRIHYFLTPLYFFYGIIGLIDIGIPPIALLSYHLPLYIDFKKFLVHIFPILLGITITRHFAQRFVLDKYEQGSHFTGGILRVGTWWVYLAGFIYSIFRIPVPYIPTPKEGERINDWRNSIPNLLMIALNLFAIIYGLQKDFTPFTLIMSGFAGINIILLGIVVLAGQQKLLHSLSNMLNLQKLNTHDPNWWFHFRHKFIFRPLRHYLLPIFFIIATLSAFIYLFNVPYKEISLLELAPQSHKKHKTLIHPSPLNEASIPSDEHAVGRALMRPFILTGLNNSTIQNCADILQYTKRHSLIPFVNWAIPPFKPLDSIATKQQALTLHQLADLIREYQQPIIINLEISEVKAIDTTAYIKKNYIYLMSQFLDDGATNIAFAWSYSVENQQYYPGDKYIDMVLLSPKGHNDTYPVAALEAAHLHQPIFLAVNNSTISVTAQQAAQHLTAQEEQILGWGNLSHPQKIITPSSTHESSAFNENKAITTHHSFLAPDNQQQIIFDSRSKQYQWHLHGKPFYLKGIVYTPEESWRDKGWPLTRRRLIADFEQIKAMGANTISRTASTVYDRNILQVAKEADLKVVYQFWFDPSIDYTSDTVKMASLKRKIIAYIAKYKNQPAVLAWNLGNGTWNELDYYFHQPYLSQVRLAYIKFVAEVAHAIKATDPNHPIITTLNANGELTGALDDLRFAVNSIDVVGVSGYNSYQLENVNTLLKKWMPNYPYLVSEFGEKTQWNSRLPGLRINEQGRLIEPSSFEKARMYADLWTNYIEPCRADNLGGIAYCWRDRLENTATLSGITDYKGRLKPTYFALQQVWTGKPQEFPLQDAWLTFNNIVFSKKEDLMLFSAISPNNNDPSLSFEWYLCREEYLNRTDALIINYKKMDKTALRLLRAWRKRVEQKMYPMQKGRQIRFLSREVDSLHRIYLHIYNKEGQVVTASYPIHNN